MVIKSDDHATTFNITILVFAVVWLLMIMQIIKQISQGMGKERLWESSGGAPVLDNAMAILVQSCCRRSTHLTHLLVSPGLLSQTCLRTSYHKP